MDNEKIPFTNCKNWKASRKLKNIDTDQFKLKNKLQNMHENVNLEEMYGNYIKDITSIIEKHAPISRRKLTKKQHKSWFDEEAISLRSIEGKLKKHGKKANVSWTKSNTYMLTNVTSDTNIILKRKL